MYLVFDLILILYAQQNDNDISAHKTTIALMLVRLDLTHTAVFITSTHHRTGSIMW